MSSDFQPGYLSELTGEEQLEMLLHYHYGFHVKEAKPIRGIVRLRTDQGTYVLKRVKPGEKDRWHLIKQVAEHVNGKQEKRVTLPEPLDTGAKKLYFDGFRYAYVLLPWMEGETVSLSGLDEWARLSESLSLLHQATADFQPSKEHAEYSRLSAKESHLKKALQQIEIFHLAAKLTSYPSDLDRTWLDISGYTIGMMENMIKYYQKINGDEACRETVKFGKICHSRLHRHNLLQAGEQSVFLDWNEMTLDVRTADLADWLMYAYGCTGSPGVLQAILAGYQQVAPLDESEYSLIYAQFLFPGKLTRLLQNVYLNQTLSETAAVSRVRTAIDIEEKKEGLLKMYANVVKDHFGVTIPQLDWLETKKS
ncbi:phosphotransferase [Thermoactinomyces sp. CICC 10521]|jgi:CotS family spore coat protein|uniref:phosphotransferase n=1 Tax=Thermoactinomyces sp. CICC 10521 TaxID=2767426 RepID=UPI0018DBB41F|nr:phosphotransferase [Thermoactinomyces sp. CICC 10521]MBH8608348.1 phosphotransferase [Thermoactinomyces sp. CICC 10521]